MKARQQPRSEITDLVADILHRIETGGGNKLRELEEAKGHQLFAPGDTEWFAADDWYHDPVVSRQGRNIRLVSIHALEPGNGALSRLVDRIIAAGFVPVVVEPFAHMEAIMKRWGWHGRSVGHDFDTFETHWFPTRKWRDVRINRVTR